MDHETRLDHVLRTLGDSPAGDVPEGFMGGVWLRAGQLTEATNARRRLILFAAIFVTGLGSGFWTVQAPTRSPPQSLQLLAGADLSPAALLHVQS